MKVKDLEVGKHYYVARSNDWQTEISTWGTREIVILANMRVGWWKWDNKLNMYKESGSGDMYSGAQHGLLVLARNAGSKDEMRHAIVTLASIRGEYEPTMNQVTAWREKRAASEQADRTARMAQEEKVGVTVALAKLLGIKSCGHGSEIRVNADHFRAMVAELEKQGWKYE